MPETIITELPNPSGFASDPFTETLHDGARKLIEKAIQAELSELMAGFSGDKLAHGRAGLVRHAHLPERQVMTGIGPVPMKVRRVSDRKRGADRITFTPSILPRCLRKAKSVEQRLPWLYLKAVLAGDFTVALEALLAPQDHERAERDAENDASQSQGASARPPLTGRVFPKEMPRKGRRLRQKLQPKPPLSRLMV